MDRRKIASHRMQHGRVDQFGPLDGLWVFLLPCFRLPARLVLLLGFDLAIVRRQPAHQHMAAQPIGRIGRAIRARRDLGAPQRLREPPWASSQPDGPWPSPRARSDRPATCRCRSSAGARGCRCRPCARSSEAPRALSGRASPQHLAVERSGRLRRGRSVFRPCAFFDLLRVDLQPEVRALGIVTTTILSRSPDARDRARTPSGWPCRPRIPAGCCRRFFASDRCPCTSARTALVASRTRSIA